MPVTWFLKLCLNSRGLQDARGHVICGGEVQSVWYLIHTNHRSLCKYHPKSASGMSVFLVGYVRTMKLFSQLTGTCRNLHLTSLSAHPDAAVPALLSSLSYYPENLSCYHQLGKTWVPSPVRVLKPKLDFISWLHKTEPQLSCLHFQSSMESLFGEVWIKLGLTNQICYKHRVAKLNKLFGDKQKLMLTSSVVCTWFYKCSDFGIRC